MVTFAPSGAPRTVVRGDLFIDSFDFNLLQGDEITDLPYHYTIK